MPSKSRNHMREYLLKKCCSIPPVEFQTLLEPIPRHNKVVLYYINDIQKRDTVKAEHGLKVYCNVFTWVVLVNRSL